MSELLALRAPPARTDQVEGLDADDRKAAGAVTTVLALRASTGTERWNESVGR
jgi:hypothetical protein